MSQLAQSAADSPASHRAKRPRARDIRRITAPCSAKAALGQLAPGCEIFGLTKGQFSLLDLIVAILDQTGPAHATISTWTAAQRAIDETHKLLKDERFLSMRWLVDFSFLRRQPQYCKLLRQRFGDDVIRVTKNHAKFAVIQNDHWNIALRTSMNLNHNARFENFEISDDPELCAFLNQLVDDLFEHHSPDAIGVDRPIGHIRTFLGFDANEATVQQTAHLGGSLDLFDSAG